MTARLREVLRAAAAEVPAYDLAERALLATARRGRRRRVTAAAATLVLVALAGLALPATGTSPAGPAATAAAGALPDRIGLPPIGNRHATDRPRIGAASVVFTGEAGRLTYDDEGSIITIVDTDSDTYRIIRGGWEMTAGTDVVLSPDGRWIAHDPAEEEPRVVIVDLVTGTTRDVRSGVPGTTGTEPAAWSPDGSSLVVRDTVPTDPQRSAHRRTLSLIRVDGGPPVRLAETPDSMVPGSVVAFAPTGDRLAWQAGGVVMVAAPDGQRLATFPLAPDTHLAGKGAWAPDGRSLTVAQKTDETWTLRRVDPATGRDLGELGTPAVEGVVGIQLLGWTASGAAWVVAYLPHPPGSAAMTRPWPNDHREPYGLIGTVRVLSLTVGAAAPASLLTAPAQVVSIDVADDVIRAGRTRVADPPGGVGARFWYWTALIAVVLGTVVAYPSRTAIVLWWDDRRVRRIRGPAG